MEEWLSYVVSRVGTVEGANSRIETVTVLASILVSKIENLPTIIQSLSF